MNKLIEELKGILLEAMGYGSLCWNPRPTGVFDSNQAIDYAEKKMSEILSRHKEQEPLAVLADRKGWHIKSTTGDNLCSAGRWLLQVGENSSNAYNNYWGKTYAAAEAAARQYLNTIYDKGESK